MYDNKKILAIIPARGGSKSIPKKNIIDLNGQPLISYSINTARQSKYLDRTIVSSDDAEILAVAEKYGAETVKRPAELAQDNSSMLGALKHTLEVLAAKDNFRPDYIVLLQPTSPLRTAKTVDSAIEAFAAKADEFDFLMPLHEIESKVGRIKDGRYFPLTHQVGKQRQELEPLYQECGTIFIFKPDVIEKSEQGFGERIFPFIIESEEEASDIDCYEDLEMASYYLNK